MSTVTLYKNHGKTIGIWSISIAGESSLECKLLIQHAKSLDGKVVNSSVNVKGKNIGRANETTAYEQAQKELASRVKKQLDKGYVRTQEEAKAPATNALGLQQPMLAARWDQRKAKLSPFDLHHSCIQPKLDGNRMLAQGGKAWTRGGKIRTTVDHILKELADAGLEGLGLDGELYIHGVRLQDINSLVKKFRPSQHPNLPSNLTGHYSPELVAQLGTDDLEFHVYDVFSTDLTYPDRLDLLAKRIPHNLPHVKLVPTYALRGGDEDRASLDDVFASVDRKHEEFVANGYEGAVVRLSHGIYEAKRSLQLLKVKDFVDAEFEIVGVEERQASSTEVSTAFVEELTRVYGFDAATMVDSGVIHLRSGVWVLRTADGKTFNTTIQGDMFEKHKFFTEALEGNYLGRMLTVRYIYLSTEGIPQIPVALQFREND